MVAEKVAEETVIAGGTGREDYRKDFRYLSQIDKTHTELPYSLASYFEVSNTDLGEGETKTYRMQAYGQGVESEGRDRYFISAKIKGLGDANFLGQGAPLRRHGEGIKLYIYTDLDSVITPVLERLFFAKKYRPMIWNNRWPIIWLNANPAQLIKIPAGAKFYMAITNYTPTSGEWFPMANFMEIL